MGSSCLGQLATATVCREWAETKAAFTEEEPISKPRRYVIEAKIGVGVKIVAYWIKNTWFLKGPRKCVTSNGV